LWNKRGTTVGRCRVASPAASRLLLRHERLPRRSPRLAALRCAPAVQHSMLVLHPSENVTKMLEVATRRARQVAPSSVPPFKGRGRRCMPLGTLWASPSTHTRASLCGNDACSGSEQPKCTSSALQLGRAAACAGLRPRVHCGHRALTWGKHLQHCRSAAC
jgi:hypothetical protein